MSGERSTVATATWVAGTIIAQQVAAKATRDAYFLQQFDASDLATVMTVTASLAVVAAWGLSRMLARLSPLRAVRSMFVVSGGLFVLSWWLSSTAPGAAATLSYIHTGVLGAVTVSTFWSLVNESLDPHTAKMSMGRLGRGATAGGVLGGLAAWGIASVSDVTAMLAVLGGLNFACAGVVGLIATPTAEVAKPAPAPSFVAAFRATPYLWRLSALLGLVQLADTLIEYVFKARAGDAFSGSELAAFFSLFYAGAAVVTFGFQAGATQPALERLGLSRTAAILPGGTALAAVASLLLPGLGSAVLLRGVTSAAENSLFRSAYELGYTALPAEKKRPTKTLIDVGSGKLAAALGGGMSLVLVAGMGASGAASAATAFVLVIGIATLAVAWALDAGYKGALADALRSGAVRLSPDELVDASTRVTYAESMAIDRKALLAQIAAARGDLPAPGATTGHHPQDPLPHAMAALDSRNSGRIRAVLVENDPLPDALVSRSVGLLAMDEVFVDVLMALRRVVDAQVELLCSALTNPETPFAVRRRLPRVLRASTRQEAADALITALSDARFEVRYRAAIALLRVRRRCPDLAVDADAILDAVLRETDVGGEVWNGQTLIDSTDAEDPVPFDGTTRGALTRHSLSYVFTLLAVVLDPEPLLLAYAALASEDDKLRGTGLEYVEVVLPDNVRERLWPYLTSGPRDARTRSTRAELVAQLRSSTDSLVLDRRALRELLRDGDG